MNQVSLNAFEGTDDMARFAAAMEYLREHAGTELIVPPGVYEITSPLAMESMNAVMRGDWGENPQRIMFNPKFKYTRGVSLDGQKGSVISAYGAVLMVRGFMEPLSIVNCADVEVRGLTIDHVRKPFSRGTVTELGDIDSEGLRSAVIAFDDDCPIQPHTPILLRWLFYDAASGRDIRADISSYTFMDSHHIAARLRGAESMENGALYYTIHTYHSRPAILIENAKNVHLTDVTIHSQPGMGIVGNRSENITLTRLSIIPSAGYHMSTNTDATHFTSIKGLLRFEDCAFDGQGDDSTNVHAYYQAIVGKEGEQTYLIQEKTPDGTHAQSLDYPDVGDSMELTKRSTLECLDTFTVTACVPLPDEWMCRVTLDRPLPEDTEGLLLADVTRLPRLEIIGCRATHHFARGVLIKTRGVLVEGCTFRATQCPAVVASAEGWWSEGVSPADVTIRGNTMIDCGEVLGQASGVVIATACDQPETRNIRNVVIENNIIRAPRCDHGMYLRGIEGLKISGNVIVCRKEPIVVEDCSLVE